MSRLRRILRDRDGGALVEFALVLPFMILMLAGSVELVAAFDAQRKVDHVAFAVADIVAQASKTQPVTNASLADVMTAGQALISPLPAGATLLSQKVASVTADAKGQASVDWIYPAGAALSVPAGAVQAGQSLIVAEADYVYAPFSSSVWPGRATLTFRKQAWLQPRYLTKVPAPTS